MEELEWARGYVFSVANGPHGPFRSQGGLILYGLGQMYHTESGKHEDMVMGPAWGANEAEVWYFWGHLVSETARALFDELVKRTGDDPFTDSRWKPGKPDSGDGSLGSLAVINA